MIIIMKPQASKEDVQKVTSLIESKGLQVHLSEGSQVTIVGVVGDKTKLAGSNIEMSEGVDKVVAVTESYKLVNKKFHPDDSVIPVGNTHIGPGTMTVMAGPCAIESKEQLLSTAFAVKRLVLPSFAAVLTTPYLPILFPGAGRRRLKIYEGSQRSDRTERDLRSYQCPCH